MHRQQLAIWCLVMFLHGASSKTATGIIWQIKPYYWINEKGISEGIVADSFRFIKSGCYFNGSEFDNLQQTVMPQGLRQFYDLFRDSVHKPYGQGELANVTSTSATWIPVIQEFGRAHLDNRSMTEKTLFTEPETAVVVRKKMISLFYKLRLGIWQTRHILVLSFLSAIIFAILVWFAERWNNPEFGKSFTFGFGTGLWWAFVTMTTVGYGDVVPRSFVGRFLTIIWMILGLAAASLMTAAVSDVVLGVDYIDLGASKVAAIRDSYEANAIIRDYNSTIYRKYNKNVITLDGIVSACDSYEEILKAVHDDKADAGVMPSYVAGWLIFELYDTLGLRVPFILKLNVPVKMLYNPTLFQDDAQYMECVNTYFEIVFNMFIRKYKIFVQEETLYVESIAEFYRTSDFIRYFTIAIGALIGAGLLYDLVFGLILFKKKSKLAKQDGTTIIPNLKHHFTDLKIKDNPLKSKDMGAGRNEELNKMRQDIMGIKENIMKINTLAKYKSSWY